jgi:hypothetical protein
VRDHHIGGWITLAWTHLPMVQAPFADFTWRRALEIVAARGHDDTDRTAIAQALAELLARAEAGPTGNQRSNRRVVARTTAATRPLPALSAEPDANPYDLDDEAPDNAIPFGVFEPLSERPYA